MPVEGNDAWLVLDCSECTMQGTSACEDCVVSYLLDRDGGAVVFDADEERALRALSDGGLVPAVRFERRTG